MSEASTEASTATETPETASAETASTDTEQQVDYAAEAEKWKSLAKKHEERAKSNAEKAKGYDELKASQMTEQEKAAAAAREEGRKEALSETTPRLILAEFKAAAKGLMEPTALASLLEDLDLSKFVTDKGEVDVDRIEKKVAALAPEPGPNKPPLGGGPRKTEKPEPKPGLDRMRNAYASGSTK